MTETPEMVPTNATGFWQVIAKTPVPETTPETPVPGTPEVSVPEPPVADSPETEPAYTVLIDAMGQNAHNIPVSTEKIGIYVTGTASNPDVIWTAADLARFPHAGILRYDQTPALDKYGTGEADIADLEQYAGTVTSFVTQTQRRIAKGENGNAYGSRDTLIATAAALRAHGVDLVHVRCVLADWNLSQTEAAALLGTKIDGIEIMGVQWASPSSNPHTIVPDSTMTLAEANVDLNVTVPSWFAPRAAPPPPPPATEYHGIVVLSDLTTYTVQSKDKKTFTID